MAIAKGYSMNLNIMSINLRENSIGGMDLDTFIKYFEVKRVRKLKSLNLANNLINEVMAMKLIKTLNDNDGPNCHINLEDNLTKTKADDELALYVSRHNDSTIVQKYMRLNRVKSLAFTRELIQKEREQKVCDEIELKKAIGDYKEGFRTIKRFKNDIEVRKEQLGKQLLK